MLVHCPAENMLIRFSFSIVHIKLWTNCVIKEYEAYDFAGIYNMPYTNFLVN